MLTPIVPKDIPPPLAPYSHGIEVPAGMRLVFCAGQIGANPDGSIPPDCASQAEIAFANVAAILREAGLTFRDVVRINTFVSAREHLKPYMDVRNRLFSEPHPASTLMIVSGFARPEFVVEIEVVAAGPAR